MRLLKYISYSGLDEDTNKFRALDIKLVKDEVDYSNIVKKVESKHKLSNEITDIINDLNRELRKHYKGRYIFNFCLDEGKNLGEIRMNKKNVDRLKMKLFEASDKLSKIKRKVEKDLKEDIK